MFDESTIVRWLLSIGLVDDDNEAHEEFAVQLWNGDGRQDFRDLIDEERESGRLSEASALDLGWIPF